MIDLFSQHKFKSFYIAFQVFEGQLEGLCEIVTFLTKSSEKLSSMASMADVLKYMPPSMCLKGYS